MNKKYKLTKETKEYLGIKLYRIEALKDFGNINKGDKGGFIEKEENLSQENDAWVYDNAQVFGNAWVFGNVWVYGDAWVYKQKLISGYFYHTKQKSEKIETVDTYNDRYEILCREPKFGEEEKPLNRTVKVRVKDGTVLEGEIIND